MAASEQISLTLKGRVQDSNGNWLNDTRVVLRGIGVETVTDPNGLFTLSFKIPGKIKTRQDKPFYILDVDKPGHIGRSFDVDSLELFQGRKPIEIELEPNPIDGDTIGFTVRMSAGNSVGHMLKDFKKISGYHSASPDIPSKVLAGLIEAQGENPNAEEMERAEFHIYIPESVKKVRAALYLSSHGMGNIHSPTLQNFAEDERVALVSVNGNPVQRGIIPVSLLDAQIAKLAEMSGHPELTEVPVITFGHSNGTGFSTCIPAQRPEKVIAWISYHPGYTPYLQFPNTEDVPSLVMCGTIDDWFIQHRQDKVVETMRRKRQAAMALMMEGEVGHGPVNEESTWAFIVEFCKAAMRVRLNEDGSLKPVVIEEGWLGAPYDQQAKGLQLLVVSPFKDFPGDRNTASWLPDEGFARVWQAYGNTSPKD